MEFCCHVFLDNIVDVAHTIVVNVLFKVAVNVILDIIFCNVQDVIVDILLTISMMSFILYKP